MLMSRSKLFFSTLALSTLVLVAPGCGKVDDDDKPKDEEPAPGPGGGDATKQDLDIGGHKVPFAKQGDRITYEGALVEDGGVFQFSSGRAYELTATQTLHVKDPEGTSSDCVAPDDYMGPEYMLWKVEGSGNPTPVASTMEIETEDGTKIPATALASFPGTVQPGTYVLEVTFISFGKACAVKGAFTFAE
jgi:hypothetical protein